MTPEAFMQLFDGALVLILVLWGFAVKYVPGIAKIPNFLIGWGAVVIACAAKLAAPDAHAQLGVGELTLPWWITGPLQSVWARHAYELLVRPVLEKLGIYKAREKDTKAGGWTWDEAPTHAGRVA